MFETFNEAYFGNEIKIEEIGFAKRVNYSWAGLTTVLRGEQTSIIKINPLLKGTHYESVLLHEMIHAFLWTTCRSLNDNKLFAACMNRIEQISGYPMTQYLYDTNAIPDSFIKKLKEHNIKKQLKGVSLMKRNFVNY